MLRGFVNSCLHRGSTIVTGCGNQERLACRYHGWEYDDGGSVKKLPDGRSFKGLNIKDERLCEVRVVTLGPLVFVGSGSADLTEMFGPLLPELQRFYARPLVEIGRQTIEQDVNWKIAVENAVESYHVPVVHPKTFRDYRDEALHKHTLDPCGTVYADLEPLSSTPSGKAAGALALLLRANNTGRRFTHAHVFPNVLFFYGDLYCDVSVVTPVSPTKLRHSVYSFAPDDLRSRRVLPLVRDLWARVAVRLGKRIFSEDLSIWQGAQAGVRAATRSATLSCREERVFAFHEHIDHRMQANTPIS